MNVHVLTRDAEHSPSGKVEVLGVVVDPVDLAHLLYDPHAMPSGAQLIERDAMLGQDGQFYWAELGVMVATPVFKRAEWEAEQAADDAFIATIPAERRQRLHPGHRPEAEKRAERSALRASRVDPVMLAKQDEANALALSVALEVAASAPDQASARALVASATRAEALAAKGDVP